MKAIGIDTGITTISLVVMDVETEKVLESRTAASGDFLETGKNWERIRDPDEIVETAMDVLEQLLALHQDTASIGFTGQMHGILYVDSDGDCASSLYLAGRKRRDLGI